jgi:hypothetical protein
VSCSNGRTDLGGPAQVSLLTPSGTTYGRSDFVIANIGVIWASAETTDAARPRIVVGRPNLGGKTLGTERQEQAERKHGEHDAGRNTGARAGITVWQECSPGLMQRDFCF